MNGPAAMCALTLVAIAGCGALAGRRQATLADLHAPWNPVPFAVDADVVASADAACSSDPEFPAGLTLSLVDARGGARLGTVYSGPGGFAACDRLTITPQGEVVGSLSWSSMGPLGRLDDGELQTEGTGQSAEHVGADAAWWAVSGQAGDDIAQVVVHVPGLPQILASRGGRWYVAWWPGSGARYRVTGFDANGAVVATTSFP